MHRMMRESESNCVIMIASLEHASRVHKQTLQPLQSTSLHLASILCKSFVHSKCHDCCCVKASLKLLKNSDDDMALRATVG